MTLMEEIPAWAALAPLVAAIAGIAVAVIFYMFVRRCRRRSPAPSGRFTCSLLNKWYFDELYDVLFVRPGIAAGEIRVADSAT